MVSNKNDVMTEEQAKCFVDIVVRELLSMSREEASMVLARQKLLANEIHGVVQRRIRNLRVPRLPHCRDGEEFEMEFDADAPENLPRNMVMQFAGRIEGGEYVLTGRKMTGVHRRRFKWVRVEGNRGLGGVREQLIKYGRIPEGQWIFAVLAQFETDGITRRSIAEETWRGPSGAVYVPSIHPKFDGLDHEWAVINFSSDIRWLIEVGERSV